MTDQINTMLLQRRASLLSAIERDKQMIANLHRGIEMQVVNARHRIEIDNAELTDVDRALRERGFSL